MLCGLHPHQFPAQREDKLSQLRVPVWTVLNMDIGYYQRFIAPDARVILRIYDPDVMGHPPEQWADRCHREMLEIVTRAGGDPRRFILQGYNELNLEVEHNGQGYNGQPWDSDEGFRARLEWLMRFHRTLVGYHLPYRVGGPWDSPGHQDVDGRQEVRQYALAGLYEFLDVFGGHYYAEGPDRGGFDAPDREWYSDRVLKVRAMLDSNGHSALPIWIGECNRKQVDVGDVLAEYDRYCGRIAASVEAITWFIWSSGDPAFGDMQWSKIADRAPAMQAIFDKYAGVQPGPIPPDPEPPIDPPTPPTGEIARIEQIYGITHTDGAEIYLARLEERTDPANISATGPADLTVRVSTNDNQHQAAGMGRADLGFTHPAQYQPSQGERGFFYATAGGARVDGLGWAYDAPPVMQGPHTNVVAHFARRTAPPDPQPQPPAEDGGWFGAFAEKYRANPAAIGKAAGPIAYLPASFVSAAQDGEKVVQVWDGKKATVVPK